MNVKIMGCLLFFPIFLFAGRKGEANRKKLVGSSGSLINDKKEGKWEYFYPSGERLAIENFTEGQLNGKVSYFFQDGKIQAIEKLE